MPISEIIENLIILRETGECVSQTIVLDEAIMRLIATTICN